jgi:hypothetical protein
MRLPQMAENLIILNLPHPNGLARTARQTRSDQEQRVREELPDQIAIDPTVFFGRAKRPISP